MPLDEEGSDEREDERRAPP